MRLKKTIFNRSINNPKKRKTGCDNGGNPTNIKPAEPLPSPNKLVDASGRVFARSDKMEPEITAALDAIIDGVKTE